MKVNFFAQKHYKRLLCEAVLKSALLGSAIGLGIDFVSAFIYWMFCIGNVWVGILIGLFGGVVSGLLLYRFAFRPTDASVSKRIDRLGLEERMITMLELKDDTSYIASLQRKDAESRLSAVAAKSIRYKISHKIIVAVATAAVMSVAFTTLGVLAMNQKLPYGKDILLGNYDDGLFDVEYLADEGGSIRGDTSQQIKPGESTSSVRAVADEGWAFVGWDDAQTSPERCESNVKGDMKLTALFKKVERKSKDPWDESDSADDTPFASSSNQGGGGSSDEEGGENPDEGDGGQGGGKWQDKNQFIDGATYYRDYLELYYKYAMEIFDAATDIPAEIIEFFETYFSGI